MTIRPVTDVNEFEECAIVMRNSFATVAASFGLTPKNAPTNAAFTNAVRLRESFEKGTAFFCIFEGDHMIGTIAVEKSKDHDDLFYIERLAVLPEYRHKGYGALLMDHACAEIIHRGGTRVSIGIINENEILKKWYSEYGFVETGTKRFEHLPFTVCFMEKSLIQR
jgi:ribosomal protein S18 acetylase RimI-like enzyme